VNLKPLLPGHVLVCPVRPVPRLRDLSHLEMTDLFIMVQRVSNMIERVYNASSLNIAIQDGADAGQSVPHVHAHIIPRIKGDLNRPDEVYRLLESEDGDLGKNYEHKERDNERGKFPAVDADENRKPRSEEEMNKEAERLAEEMSKERL
jgi:bis(5'-adenosyl)-triphosphatase